MQEKILLGKNILITGTNRGMGKQMLQTFAENGANIFAHARKHTVEHENFCSDIAEANSVKIIPVYFEITSQEEIKRGVQEIRATKLPVTGLVNNAGIIYNALFQMTNIAEVRKQFEVNFFAPFLLTQYISKLMVRNQIGSIVNISSSVAIDGNSGKSAYGSSKAALICMTKCIAEELGSFGIRANAICPSVTETDMLSDMSEEVLNLQLKSTFLGKLGKPIDIANTAMFLLSDRSSYITGQIFRVDGGITEHYKRK